VVLEVEKKVVVVVIAVLVVVPSSLQSALQLRRLIRSLPWVVGRLALVLEHTTPQTIR